MHIHAWSKFDSAGDIVAGVSPARVKELQLAPLRPQLNLLNHFFELRTEHIHTSAHKIATERDVEPISLFAFQIRCQQIPSHLWFIMSLAEIKDAVGSLSSGELAELAAFIRERENAAWDRQIDDDFADNGRLRPLLDEVREDIRAGRLDDLPWSAGHKSASGNSSERCHLKFKNSRAKNTPSGNLIPITRRCISKSATMGFASFESESTTAPSDYVKAIRSHGSGSAHTRNTTVFGFDFCTCPEPDPWPLTSDSWFLRRSSLVPWSAKDNKESQSTLNYRLCSYSVTSSSCVPRPHPHFRRLGRGRARRGANIVSRLRR